MVLDEQIIPARYGKIGREMFTITHPANLKIQTTGGGATMVLNDGPPSGKRWCVTLQLDIAEFDAP